LKEIEAEVEVRRRRWIAYLNCMPFSFFLNGEPVLEIICTPFWYREFFWQIKKVRLIYQFKQF